MLRPTYRLAVTAAMALLLACTAATVDAAAQGRQPEAKQAAQRRAALKPVKSWAIQYRRIEVAEIAASPFDLVVLDYRPDVLYGTEWPFQRADLERMRRKPDGGRRLVLAYLSVGEAEDYRWYWPRNWTTEPAGRPAWIGKENPRWRGNFPVRLWEPAWQQIVFAGPQSYLSRIIESGFDGVYLDRVDVYLEWQRERPTAEQDAVELVRRLAGYARARDPRFIVVLQNAEELTARSVIRSTIDAFAKEDLFFGIAHDGTRNSAEAVDYAVKPMRSLQRAGVKVLLVEYPRDVAAASEVRARARSEGFTLLLADRRLGALAPVFAGQD